MAHPAPVYSCIFKGTSYRVRPDTWPADDPRELTQMPNTGAVVLQGHARGEFAQLAPGARVLLVLANGACKSFHVRSNEVFEHVGAAASPDIVTAARAPYKSLTTGHTLAPNELMRSMFNGGSELVLYTCVERPGFDGRRFVVCDPI